MINKHRFFLKVPWANSIFGTLLTISVVFFLSFCLVGYLWITFEYSNLDKESTRYKEEFIANNKQQLANEVRRIKQSLLEEQYLAEGKLQERLKRRVTEAHQIAQSIYQQQRGIFSDQAIRNTIISALRDVELNEGRGYYFIVDQQGSVILYPPDDFLASFTKQFVFSESKQESLNQLTGIIKENQEGSLRYQWDSAESGHQDKFTYVKTFEPYGWLIGTGAYLEPFENRLKEEAFRRIAKVTYGPNHEGYFFINSYDGDLYVTNGKYFGGNKNIWDATDARGTKVVQENSNLAQTNPEGAFNTYFWEKKSGQQAEKLSFVLGMDEWQVFIGTGAYIDTLDSIIAQRIQQRKDELNQKIVKAITVVAIAMLIILAVLFIITRKLKLNLEHFQDSLLNSVDTWSRLDPESIHFAEFRHVADNVNSMVDRLNGQAEALRHRAFHDHLTNLPNRRYSWEHLNTMVNEAKQQNAMGALMFIDLDNFKEVNDTLGHLAGDELLQQVSQRLCKVLQANDTVARLGGDEFTIITDLLRDKAHAESIANKLLAQFSEPYNIQGQSLRVTASIGVSIFPQDGDNAEILLRNADSAMYQAKKEGKNCFSFYHLKMTQDVSERFLLTDQIHEALSSNQFELYYQPQLCVESLNVVGAEALIRWNHPEKGLVSPDQFIPYAEESGLINLIGVWVIKQACQQMVEWQTAGIDIGTMAINVSARQLDEAFINVVGFIFKETGCDPNCIEFEITESALMENPERSKNALYSLRELGISLSIDDFGTGYSSLSYLKLLPISKLKIDRSFIRDIEHDDNDKAITRAIIGLGQSLNIEVIAEGVETQQQLAYLRQEECAMMQGYLYCKPLPPEQVVTFLSAHEVSNNAGQPDESSIRVS